MMACISQVARCLFQNGSNAANRVKTVRIANAARAKERKHQHDVIAGKIEMEESGKPSANPDVRCVHLVKRFIASKRRILGCDAGPPPAFFAVAREELLR